MEEELTKFQSDLLVAVASCDEPSAMDVRTWLNESPMPAYSDVQRPRMYPNLDTLVENGLVAKRVEGRENRYHLTEDGMTVLRAWADSVERAIA